MDVRRLLGICLGCLMAAGIALGLGAPTAAAAGPSFDCRKASAPDEQAICNNPQLSQIDQLVNQAYRGFQPEFVRDKRVIARQFLDDRQACGRDEACIANVQNSELMTFQQQVPWVESYAEALIGQKAMALARQTPASADAPLPDAIGACAPTHIAKLTTRFGEPLRGADPSSGVGMEFSNGGGQVSYDVPDALYDARPRDQIMVCLMSIPRDCPAGDERGRIYYSVDLRTQGTWVMPDSQHMCGGA